MSDNDSIIRPETIDDHARAAMQELQGTGSHGATSGQPVFQTAASKLEDMWKELLNVATIKPEDGFFDLGGDSLTAIRLIERIRMEFGDYVIEPDIIYTANRFEDMARELAQALDRR